MRVTFLFGAGASVEFGVPTMAQFTEGFWDFLREIEVGREFAVEVEGLLRPLADGGDLEHLMSGLQALAQSGPTWVRAFDTDGRLAKGDVEALHRRADEALALLTYYIVGKCSELDRSEAVAHFEPLLRAVTQGGAPVTLFTTNYDQALEATASAMKLPYADGFVWSDEEHLLVWKKEFGHPLRIIKLHGSVTWYGEEGGGGETVYRMRDAYAFPNRGFYVARDGADGAPSRRLSPFMIIPTMEKEALRSPYIDYQFLFRDELTECRLLVVLGNSLRDGHLRKVIEDRIDGLLVLFVGLDAARFNPLRGRPERVVTLEATTTEFCRHAPPLLGDLLGRGPDIGALRKFARSVREAIDLETRAEPQVLRWVEAVKTGNIAERVEAAGALGAHPSASASPALLDALGHDSEDVRMAATAALARRGDTAAVPVLGRHAVDPSRSQRERVEAALGLGALGGPEAERTLRELAASLQASSVLKRVAEHALGRARDGEVQTEAKGAAAP